MKHTLKDLLKGYPPLKSKASKAMADAMTQGAELVEPYDDKVNDTLDHVVKGSGVKRSPLRRGDRTDVQEGLAKKATRLLDKVTGSQRSRLFNKIDQQMDDRQMQTMGTLARDASSAQLKKLSADERYSDLNRRWMRTNRFYKDYKKPNYLSGKVSEEVISEGPKLRALKTAAIDAAKMMPNAALIGASAGMAGIAAGHPNPDQLAGLGTALAGGYLASRAVEKYRSRKAVELAADRLEKSRSVGPATDFFKRKSKSMNEGKMASRIRATAAAAKSLVTDLPMVGMTTALGGGIGIMPPGDAKTGLTMAGVGAAAGTAAALHNAYKEYKSTRRWDDHFDDRPSKSPRKKSKNPLKETSELLELSKNLLHRYRKKVEDDMGYHHQWLSPKKVYDRENSYNLAGKKVGHNVPSHNYYQTDVKVHATPVNKGRPLRVVK